MCRPCSSLCPVEKVCSTARGSRRTQTDQFRDFGRGTKHGRGLTATIMIDLTLPGVVNDRSKSIRIILAFRSDHAPHIFSVVVGGVQGSYDGVAVSPVGEASTARTGPWLGPQ